GIGFLQHPDNLLFAEPRLLHDKVSPAALPLTLQWDTSEGEGHLPINLMRREDALLCLFRAR
ncbi:hypothetical protein, partial [Burkholderia sp. Se-20373]|uniref:hypothetical protein n=1 Tax=Burkholderia sp. Se-20373 TaxID=2703898 RepID=UPI001980826A